jgi:senataxin
LNHCSELKALPSDQHLFCPRRGDDGSAYFDEDIASFPQNTDPEAIAERKEKVQQAQERKWLALDALQILAFDGDEAEPYQTWIKDRLHHLMKSCDVCVRVFHQSRTDWKNRLVE